MKKLIVNADDFGLSAETNRGIIEAYQNGIVTSATLIVNMPAFEDAVLRAKKDPRLGTGIHLNLTAGKPLSPLKEVYQLVDSQGSFIKDKRRIFFKLFFRRTDSKQIKFELEAQIRKFFDSGLKLTHIDTHHHLILIPMVYNIVLSLMHKYNISGLRFYKAKGSYFSDQFKILKKAMVYLVENKTKVVNFRSPDYIFDIEGINLKQRLSQLGDGVNEIFCHPGYADKELEQISSLTKKREEELKQLIDPSVKRIIKSQSITLINYSGF